MLPLYNLHRNLTATLLEKNTEHSNDYRTTKTLLYYQQTKDALLLSWTKPNISTKSTLVNDKRTYEELTVNPAPKLQKGLNAKLLELKKRDLLSYNLYHRLRCSAPQSPKLYGLPKLRKLQTPMRPIVSFSGSPTYQLSKHLAKTLKPLTDASYHKLQSTENLMLSRPYRYRTTTDLCLLM